MSATSSQNGKNLNADSGENAPESAKEKLLKSLESLRSQPQNGENPAEKSGKGRDKRKNDAKSDAKKDAAPKKSDGGNGSDDETPQSTFQQIREIFESLAVALFLAFLFKTFEAEAFVIPTGSMAPTLKGRHKDVVCDECNFPFQTSASEEMDAATNRPNGRRVVAGTCPQCGFTQYFGEETPSPKKDKNAPSYTGDRILVSKLTFDQRELARWDVSVFRSPAEPKINFIKRIVGLPNERLRVQYGDLFVQKTDADATETPESEFVSNGFNDSNGGSAEWAPDVDLSDAFGSGNGNGVGGGSGDAASGNDGDSGKPFEIARKDWKYLRQILQTVYDADYPSPKLRELGWPSRWTDDLAARGDGVVGWTETEAGKKRIAFRFEGGPVETSASGGDGAATRLKLATEADVSPIGADDAELCWTRYRHVVPSSSDWLYLAAGRLPPDAAKSGVVANNPRLIDDFSAYNAGISRRAAALPGTNNLAWDDGPGDEFYELSRRVVAPDGSERIVCAQNPDGFGCNWVGDLAVSFDLTVEKTAADSDKIALDLVKGGVVFRCSIAPRAGTITLEIPGVPAFVPSTVAFPFREGRTYSVVFINIDEEMRVVVDGEELAFPTADGAATSGGGRYDALAATGDVPRNRDPNARDLAPVALGARGVTVRVERLKVLRDVYYIAAGRKLERWDSRRFFDLGTARCDRLTETRNALADEDDYSRFMSTPSAWRGYGNTKSALLRQRDGQYVAFGDNSGFSLDSRLWASNAVPHYVDRKYLIGKAFFVYWPHGKPIPGTSLPYLPNFRDMRRVD